MSGHPSDAILKRMEALHPKLIDLTLDRVLRLLERLGAPHERLPGVVHIAGTNGKGSTLAMIRAGLEGAGRRVHAYTSPHLTRFHERIRLAGELIGEPDLAAVLDECEAANGGAPITYFEITTCAAMLAMSRTPAEHALLEVGLGGRLDATNVVAKPELTVITPVSIDHTSFLGETVAEIAAEKAGILKPGICCVVGPQCGAALEVIEDAARRLGAPLLVHGQHWHAFEERGRMVYQDETGLRDLPLPSLPGAHQIDNAGCAVAALRRLEAGDAAPEAAVAKAKWPARMQRIARGPLADAAPRAEIWLDGGHNPAAGAAIAAHLDRMPPRPTHLICAMMNTKDVQGYLAPLAERCAQLVAIGIPGESATLAAEDTAAAAAAVGMRASSAESALEAARAIAAEAPQARILVCGSLHLAGVILRDHG